MLLFFYLLDSSFAMVSLQSLRPGQKVALIDHNEFSCTGIVFSVDPAKRLLKLKDVMDNDTGKSEPGIQVFQQRTIKKLTLVEDSQADEPEMRVPSASYSAYQSAPPSESNMPSNCVSKRRFRNDNPHLRKLIHLDMPAILKQKQNPPVPSLAVLNLQLGSPKDIPFPTQDFEHMEGEKFKNRQLPEFEAVRDYSWTNLLTPPELKAIPQKLYLIKSEKSDVFEFAIEEIRAQKMIGVALEGHIGRSGFLSILSVATVKSVFLFDTTVMGPGSLQRQDSKLREILECSSIKKVMHDVRQPSDMLYNKFQIELKNVYDTLAAHVVFATWALYAGYLPKYAASYNNSVRCYLGVETKFLFFQHLRLDHLELDAGIWNKRPLQPELEIGAMRNVMYLLDLHRMTRLCQDAPMKLATARLLGVVRDVRDLWRNLKVG